MIGIKPPRLLDRADRTIGGLLFRRGPDLHKKAELTTCHELTHACSARLKLPAWLNEGLAAVTAGGGAMVAANTAPASRAR